MFDPLKLAFNLMNTLMKKGIIKYADAEEILMETLPDSMFPNEKKSIVESFLVHK